MELCGAFKCGTAVLFYVVYFLRSVSYVNGLEHYPTDHDKPSPGSVSKPEEFLFFYQGVEGTPGVDFPVYSHIPRTTFSCKGLESGYYADIDTECQVFHICEEEKKISFLCPNGTIFQQTDLICEWWFKVNCSNSPYLYEESAENLRENTARRKFNQKVQLNSQEKTSQLKGNSFVDEVDSNKYNEQYFNNKRNNHLGPTQSNSFVAKPLSNSKPSLPPQTTNKPTKTRNNHNKNSQKTVHFENIGRNRISNINRSKQEPTAHQKTRRFNENDLGNYENTDYDKFTTTQISTFATPTENYLENVKKTQKGYYVQFPSSATGMGDAPSRIDSNIGKGPEYSSDESSDKKDQFKLYNHINKKQGSTETNKGIIDSNMNDYVDKNSTGSDESQIPQETASFVKNSLNSIQETSSYNPFPNHRTTYSDLKTIPHVSTKIYSTISSVTPQYITTQPINNGKPFLGSRVGMKVKSAKDPLFINPQALKNTTKVDKSLDVDDVFRVHVQKNMTRSSLVTPKMLEKILFAKIKPIDESTTSVTKNIYETPDHILTVDLVSTTTESIIPINNLNTSRANNIQTRSRKEYATATGITTKPFLIQLEDPPAPVHISNTKSTTTKPKTTDYAIVYGSFSSSTPVSTPSNSVQVKFDKTVHKVGIQLGKSFGSPTPRPISVVKIIDNKPVKLQHSTVSEDRSKEEILLRHSSNSIAQSLRDSEKIKTSNRVNDNRYYVTKSKAVHSTTVKPIENLSDGRIYNITIRSTTQQPRPFQRSLFETLSTVPSVETGARQKTYLDYQISTAGPFKSLSSVPPTLPTPLISSTPSIDEHVDNMIDVLTAITKEKGMSSVNSRPGLVVPPSVGPQTLHTLSVYFANALDEVIAQKVKSSGKYPEKFMMDNKEKLTTLLTQMTVHGYNQLFNQKQANNYTEDDLPVKSDSKNQTEQFVIESPQIRQLAKNFTLALSAYLHDPEMFRKDLANFRPTEPPFDVEVETTTELNSVDEELLNYSDSDTRTNYPPIFTTSQPPVPTWGFIIAAKSPNVLDVDNVINSDLNTADTQSFVPGLNDINSNGGRNKGRTQKELPQDHWTTSTSATELWKSTFSVDPSLVNDEFDSTPPLLFETSTEAEFTTPENLPVLGQSREINYELRSLPNFSINSSEVSGILIDFMNNSTDDSNNKLHRILRKLNTTEDEFLVKMKEIEANPVTRRLILLLISECGKNATEDIKKHNEESFESLELSESNPLLPNQLNEQATQMRHNSLNVLLGSNLKEDDQDTRALQLLNTLYSIASKFGK